MGPASRAVSRIDDPIHRRWQTLSTRVSRDKRDAWSTSDLISAGNAGSPKLALIVRGENKTRTIRVFRLKDLKTPLPNDPGIDKQPNVYIWTLSRSEVIKRLNRGQCEYCETKQGPFEIHHIRKLKDVVKGKALWQQLMAAKRRKTLVLCQACHQQLHTGMLPDKEHLKKYVKGEPVALKGARRVLRGGAG